MGVDRGVESMVAIMPVERTSGPRTVRSEVR